MKLRLKIIKCIQEICILSIIVFTTLIIGGAEYQEQWLDFVWQFRTGLLLALLSVIVAGCMELLKRYESYRVKKITEIYLEERFENLKKPNRLADLVRR